MKKVKKNGEEGEKMVKINEREGLVRLKIK